MSDFPMVLKYVLLVMLAILCIRYGLILMIMLVGWVANLPRTLGENLFKPRKEGGGEFDE